MTLAIDSSIRVRSASAGTSAGFFASRFRHGRHYGATRRLASHGERLARIVAAPLVAPLMLLRIFQRVAAKQPQLLRRFLLALPHMVFFVAGWTFGEMTGLALRRP
jgi:hypothetical protein